jgi:hypothetical protein
MQHWIDRVKDTVMEILDRLKGLYPEAQLRTVSRFEAIERFRDN